jgi:collagenase-like PrtC family protease
MMMTEAFKAGFGRFYCESLWAVTICQKLSAPWVGGAYLNITNSQGAAYYTDKNAETLTLSFELTLRQALDISSKVATGLVIYGRLPLMKYRNCPVK